MPPGKTLPAMAAVRSSSSERPTPEALTVLLERHRGNVGHVARELGRQRTLVWRWLRRAGIESGALSQRRLIRSGAATLRLPQSRGPTRAIIMDGGLGSTTAATCGAVGAAQRQIDTYLDTYL